MPDKIKRIKCLSSTLRQSPGEEILGWTQGACIIILFAIFERNRRNNSSGNAILQSGKKILIETTNLFRFVVSGWRGGIIVESGLQIKIQNRWKISSWNFAKMLRHKASQRNTKSYSHLCLSLMFVYSLAVRERESLSKASGSNQFTVYNWSWFDLLQQKICVLSWEIGSACKDKTHRYIFFVYFISLSLRQTELILM